MSKRVKVLTWLLLILMVMAGGSFLSARRSALAVNSSAATAIVGQAAWYMGQSNGYTQDWRRTGYRDSSGTYWFDCSGFVYRVFEDEHVGNLIKDSSDIKQQYTSGPQFQITTTNESQPPPSQLTVGDLVFFGGTFGNTTSLDHVGIISRLGSTLGNTKFISPTTYGSSIQENLIMYWHDTPNALVFLPFAGTGHNPVTVRNSDGRMEVFQVGNSGQLYYQTEDNQGNWQGWHSLGGNWPGQPAVGRNLDGHLEIFIVGNQGPTGGGLFHSWQTRAGDDSSWTGWNIMAGAWPPGTPAVAHNLSGGLEVFMHGLDQNLYHAWQSTSGSSNSYSGWSPMGGSWNMDPVVANNANGTLQVFMVGFSTQLYYNQESSNGGWSGWQNLGGSWPGQPAVILNVSSQLEVFVVGNQGPTGAGLFHAWQVSPENGSWTGWSMLPGGWHAGTPFVARNGNGTADVFLVGQGAGNDTALYHDYENPNGSWSGPQSLGGYWPGEPSVTRNLPGGLEGFMMGQSGEIYHAWENNAGDSSSYSNWYTLGVPQ